MLPFITTNMRQTTNDSVTITDAKYNGPRQVALLKALHVYQKKKNYKGFQSTMCLINSVSHFSVPPLTKDVRTKKHYCV